MTRQQEQLRTQRLAMLYGTLTENQPPRTVVVKNSSRVNTKGLFIVIRHEPMACEHLYDFYRTRKFKYRDIRFDAFKKMAREYRKAARDADYAATFWRP